MKYVKSISLFFVYPFFCFLAGLLVGFSFVEIPVVIPDEKDYVYEEAEGQSEFEEKKETGQKDEALISAGKKGIANTETQTGETVENMAVQAQIQPGNTVQNISPEEGYVLLNQNGHVVVYHMDRKTIFLSTSILAAELPGDVQAKLDQGLELPDEGSLYDFLENYTS